MMKRLFILLSICFFVCGCSTITYESDNGETFTYTRIGTQSLQGLNVAKGDNGQIRVSIEKSDGSAGDMAEALKNMSEVAKAASQ